MKDTNYLVLGGRIAKDAEFKTLASGLRISTFFIANNDIAIKNDGSYEEKCNFFPIVIFGDYAEKLLPYLRKGQNVIVEGSIKQDKWEKDEKKFSQISIKAKRIQLVGPKKQELQDEQKMIEQNSTETEKEKLVSSSEYAEAMDELADTNFNIF